MKKVNSLSRPRNSIMMRKPDSFWQTGISQVPVLIVEMIQPMVTSVKNAEHL